MAASMTRMDGKQRGSHWAHFLMASLVVGAALYRAGAPLLPLLAAVAGCALWNMRRSR